MLSLPNEILGQIVKYLDSQQDISSLCRINHRFHWLFNRYLYQFNVYFLDGNAIVWAAKHGDEATARRFLQLGVPVNSTFLRLASSPTERVSLRAVPEGQRGIAPLHLASLKGYQNLVQLFLANGANPEARFGNEWTPLYLALLSKNEKVSRTISWYIPDITSHLIYSSKRLTPLHLASYLGSVASVRFFLSKGINVNVLDLAGNTPLHHALASKSHHLGYDPIQCTPSEKVKVASLNEVIETIQTLLEAGADTDREGFASRTPENLASSNENERVRKLFGLVPNQLVSTRSKEVAVHIGRSWMLSNQHFAEEQELNCNDLFLCAYRLQSFKVTGLTEREEVLRNCVPKSDAPSDHDNPNGITAPGSNDFPLLSGTCNSANPTGLDSPKAHAWSQSKTTAVIAHMLKREWNQPSPVQQHEKIEPFPQLVHSNSENSLRLSAANIWTEFRQGSITRGSVTADQPAREARRAKGKHRWQPLTL